MLSSDPALSICLAVEADTPAWRASLASALTACPKLPHEVVVLTASNEPPFDLDRPPEGLRVVRYGLTTSHPTIWQALVEARVVSVTLLGEPGVTSRTLPERAQRRLSRHERELIIPRSRTLPAGPGYWEYGADLAPDLSTTPHRDAPAAWSELPAFRARCVSFSRSWLRHLLATCGDSWLPGIVPEELSPRWWLCGGSIVADVGSSFSHAPSIARGASPAEWARERLSTATLHLSDARLTKLRRYLDAIVPGAGAREPSPELEAIRAQLMAVRVHDDDWYAARFGFEVFDSLASPVGVGG